MVSRHGLNDSRAGWFLLARIILVHPALLNFQLASIDLNPCLKLPFTNRLLRPSKKRLRLLLIVHLCLYRLGITTTLLLRPPPLQSLDLKPRKKQMKVKVHQHLLPLLTLLQATPTVVPDQ